MKKLWVIAALLALLHPAHASDNLPAIKPLKPLAPIECSATSCSGVYVGMGLTGDGANGSIQPGGIASSVFAGGLVLDAHAGYQFWNGTYLFAVEGGVGNQFSNGPVSAWGKGTVFGYEGVKIGGALSGLFGLNPATVGSVPGQASGTVPVFSSLANAVIAPYIWLGATQRGGYNQGTYGAGIEYVIAQNWNLDTRYTYSPAVGSVSTLQQITVGLNYHFGWH